LVPKTFSGTHARFKFRKTQSEHVDLGKFAPEAAKEAQLTAARDKEAESLDAFRRQVGV